MSLLKKIVEKKKSEKYAWPEGWLTREQAANDLGVAPRDVDDVLKEAIRDGDVLKQFFGVWDGRQARVVRQPGYRVASESVSGEKVAPSATKAQVKDTRDAQSKKEARIRAAIERYPHKTDREIAKNLFGVTSREVAAIRAL